MKKPKPKPKNADLLPKKMEARVQKSLPPRPKGC